MKFLRDSSLTIISQILGTLIGLGSSIIVARAYGPEGRGLYALLLLSIMAIALLANFGFGPAAVFFTGQKQVSFRESARLLLAASGTIGLLSGLVLIAGALALGRGTANAIPVTYWIVVAALTPFSLAKRYASYFFVALSDFRWYNYLNLLELGLRFLVIAAMLVGLNAGPVSILVAVASSVLLPPLLAWRKIGRRVNGVGFRPDLGLVPKFARYGIRFYFSELIPFLSLRVDQFLVGIFIGVADVGLYAAAVAVAEMLRTVALAVAPVLFGRVAGLDKDRATDLTGITSRFTMTISILGGVCLLLLGKEVMQMLYGSRFVAGTALLWLLIPGVIANNLYEILYADLAGRGKPEFGLYVRLLSLCLVILGDLLIIPKWGVGGAASIASLAQIGAGVALTVLYIKVTGQKFNMLLWVSRGDLAAIMRVVKPVFQGRTS